MEGDIKNAESVPAFKGDTEGDGPFLELIPGRHTTIPKLILTKTHCAGVSTSYTPTSYIETPRSFFKVSSNATFPSLFPFHLILINLIHVIVSLASRANAESTPRISKLMKHTVVITVRR